MKPLDLATVARWAGGKLLRGVPSQKISAVSTDTRKASLDALFVALSGVNFDAHSFLDKAVDSGASCLLVSQLNRFTEDCEAAVIHVPDTLVALQNLARHYRRSLEGLKVVGVTGSNGKTSTKDFLRAVLGGAEVVNATPGNLNNHIGLPLTILETNPEHTFGVWEMGMSNPGEIEVLAEIAAPDAAVITHIGTAHIEFMKSREAIALEKGMLVEAIGPDGFAVLNANDPETPALAARSRAQVITAGIEDGDVSAQNVQASPDGMTFDLVAGDDTAAVSLPVSGRHMVGNAVLAAAVALKLGKSITGIADALSNVELSGGRLQRRVVGGFEFLDDSYNANPDSMRAALQTLLDLPADGRRIAVLGRMAELGSLEEEEHRRLGAAAVESGVDLLVGVGDAGALIAEGAEVGNDGKCEIKHFTDASTTAAFLRSAAQSDDLILVKGSRSAAMEAVIREFEG